MQPEPRALPSFLAAWLIPVATLVYLAYPWKSSTDVPAPPPAPKALAVPA